MIEWIGSPNFKTRALLTTAIESTSLGQKAKNLYNSALKGSVVEFDEATATKNAIFAGISHAEHRGWIKRSVTHLGRPAKHGPRPDEWEWAIRKHDRIDKNDRRARFVVEGERTTPIVITITDEFIRWLAQHAHQLNVLEGKTRDEIAEELQAPRSVVNKLVRALKKQGWRESKIRTESGRKMVLKTP